MYYKIIEDDFAQDPLMEFDNFFRFLSCHRRLYADFNKIINFDGFSMENDGFYSLEHIEAFFYKNDMIYIPVYLYDHSGYEISTSPFSCPFDSGTLGYLYTTKDDLRKLYSRKRVTQKIIDQATNLMKNFVEKEWSMYLRGETFGYEITDNTGNLIESIYGFYGYENTKNAAIEHLRYISA